mmetsp:Transcript_52628/g.150678  ORF Transcript_52628/g.150678 Transcript_52628/m.150678 type:complete len:333 (-) Transcript_52628:308-1306(-)
MQLELLEPGYSLQDLHQRLVAQGGVRHEVQHKLRQEGQGSQGGGQACNRDPLVAMQPQFQKADLRHGFQSMHQARVIDTFVAAQVQLELLEVWTAFQHSSQPAVRYLLVVPQNQLQSPQGHLLANVQHVVQSDFLTSRLGAVEVHGPSVCGEVAGKGAGEPPHELGTLLVRLLCGVLLGLPQAGLLLLGFPHQPFQPLPLLLLQAQAQLQIQLLLQPPSLLPLLQPSPPRLLQDADVADALVCPPYGAEAFLLHLDHRQDDLHLQLGAIGRSDGRGDLRPHVLGAQAEVQLRLRVQKEAAPAVILGAAHAQRQGARHAAGMAGATCKHGEGR